MVWFLLGWAEMVVKNKLFNSVGPYILLNLVCWWAKNNWPGNHFGLLINGLPSPWKNGLFSFWPVNKWASMMTSSSTSVAMSSSTSITRQHSMPRHQPCRHSWQHQCHPTIAFVMEFVMFIFVINIESGLGSAGSRPIYDAQSMTVHGTVIDTVLWWFFSDLWRNCSVTDWTIRDGF